MPPARLVMTHSTHVSKPIMQKLAAKSNLIKTIVPSRLFNRKIRSDQANNKLNINLTTITPLGNNGLQCKLLMQKNF